MKEQQQALIAYIKSLNDIRGCITGSSLLPDYQEGSDVDVFLYDVKAFTKLYYTLINNPMFTILDPMEQWKAKMFENQEEKPYNKFGLTTIKLCYNTCIDVNIILKKNCSNLFSVLSSFDLDLISLGYCLVAKQTLDLTNGSVNSKIVSWNKWNPMYTSDEVWAISRVLRQFQRCIKYTKRGYNTDAVTLKYLELIDNIEKYESIFSSENFNEKLALTKANTLIMKQIMKVWLDTHTISEEENTLLNETIKLL